MFCIFGARLSRGNHVTRRRNTTLIYTRTQGFTKGSPIFVYKSVGDFSAASTCGRCASRCGSSQIVTPRVSKPMNATRGFKRMRPMHVSCVFMGSGVGISRCRTSSRRCPGNFFPSSRCTMFVGTHLWLGGGVSSVTFEVCVLLLIYLDLSDFPMRNRGCRARVAVYDFGVHNSGVSAKIGT